MLGGGCLVGRNLSVPEELKIGVRDWAQLWEVRQGEVSRGIIKAIAKDFDFVSLSQKITFFLSFFFFF